MQSIRRFAVAVAAAAMLPLTLGAQGNIYDLSVDLDDATAADDDLLSAAAFGIPETEAGVEVPQSVRKLTAGINGEVQMLLARRIDSNDVLTLDDGTAVGLFEGDVLRVKKKKACKKGSPSCGGTISNGAVTIVFSRKGGHGPSSIMIQPEGADWCRLMMFEGGRPTVVTCKPVPKA